MAIAEYLSRVKFKRDTSSNWTQYNPILLNGEIILVDTDNGELRAKIGDGEKRYTQLPFTDEVIRNLIPTDLADLKEDATHRLVTDTEKNTWNNKSNFSGSYNDLTNKPSIPTVSTSVSSTSTTTAASSSAVKQAYDLANTKLSKAFYVGSSAPSDTDIFWIDTANGGILKYYYSGSWKNVYSVWA